MTPSDFLLSAVSGVIGGFMGALSANAVRRLRDEDTWGQQEFPKTLNLSLNIIREVEACKRELRIRTLLELPIEVAFHSTAVQSRVVAAARETSATDPVLKLPNESRRLRNEIVNLVSKHFSIGFVDEAIGAHVRSEWFTFGLVYERAGPERMNTKRVRCLLINQSLLNESVLDTVTLFEQPTHEERIATLRALLRAVDKQSDYLVGNVCLTSRSADDPSRVLRALATSGQTYS